MRQPKLEQRRCRCSTEGRLQSRGDDPASDELDHPHQGRQGKQTEREVKRTCKSSVNSRQKEHSQLQTRSIRRNERAQPTAGRRIDKKNGYEHTQQQGQSGQETKTAKVRERTLEKSRRTDELVTAERDDREARIAATGAVKAGNATSRPREEKQHKVVRRTSNTQLGWRRS